MTVHIERLTSTVRLAAEQPLTEQQLEAVTRLVAERLGSSAGSSGLLATTADEGALYRSALPPLDLE